MILNGFLQEIEQAFNKAGNGLLTAVHFVEDFNHVDDEAKQFPLSYISNKVNHISRQQAFAAGRVLIKRCFVDLSLTHTMVTQDAYGAPIWPNGVTGSVSHTQRAVITAVCFNKHTNNKVSIGIDIEQLNRVQASIWPTVFTQNERVFLSKTKLPDQIKVATCLFTAKESFYKAQFPLTRQFIEYEDIEVTLDLQSPGKLNIHHEIPSIKEFNIDAFYFYFANYVFTGTLINAKS